MKFQALMLPSELEVKSLTELEALVAQARRSCLYQAKQDYPGFRYFPSRGTFVGTATKSGDQCPPHAEADCHTFDWRWKVLMDLIFEMKTKYPDVHEVYIGGGYDGAESPVARRNDDYEPWVGSWKITVWRRA